MLTHTGAFSGFSVDDIEAARAFYGGTLGLQVSVNPMGILDIQLGRGMVIAYAKPDHVPATFTILNFTVANIGAAVDELEAAGVRMVRYDMPGIEQDARGIVPASDQGPAIAWFTDPAGNVLSVIETAPPS
jgi:catechol 2,3-dioxygenase-like lactoylglutathione lyase family enzyme